MPFTSVELCSFLFTWKKVPPQLWEAGEKCKLSVGENKYVPRLRRVSFNVCQLILFDGEMHWTRRVQAVTQTRDKMRRGSVFSDHLKWQVAGDLGSLFIYLVLSSLVTERITLVQVAVEAVDRRDGGARRREAKEGTKSNSVSVA